MVSKKTGLWIGVAVFMMVCCRPEEEVKPGFEELQGTGSYTPETPYYFGDFKAIPASNPLTYEGIRLGRRLFYEKLLSKSNSISCGSCHQQSLAFTDGRARSLGFDGQQTEISSMSLANLLWVNRLHWNGKFTDLETQVLAPIQHPVEMNQDLATTVSKLQQTSLYPPLFEKAFGSSAITPENVSKALAQFVRTLVSANSRYDQFLMGNYQPTESELRGLKLFGTHPIPENGIRGGNCGDCHQGVLFAGNSQSLRGFHNNGVDGEENLKPGLSEITGKSFDRGKFRAPSLRNIALTAPYMHDGRFKTLEEVLDHYNEHAKQSSTLDVLMMEATNLIPRPPDSEVKLGLTEQEKKDIIAFMKMLTDSSFVTNPLLSDPNLR